MSSTWVKFHIPRTVFFAIQLSLVIDFSLRQFLHHQLYIFREIGSSSNNTDLTINPTVSSLVGYNHITSNYTIRMSLDNFTLEKYRQTIHVKNLSLSQSNFSCDVVDGNVTWNGPFFPHFIIVGAAKAGTTAISHFLSQVPNFLRTVRTEPHFWDFKIKDRKVDRFTPKFKCQLIQQYRGYWDARLIGPNTIVYEKTPSLLAIPKTPNSIRMILHPHIPKILIVLRDPIERFYSHYKMSYQRKLINDSSVEDIVMKDVEKLERMAIINVPPFSLDKPQQEWNQTDFLIMPENIEKSLRSCLVARGMYAPLVEGYMQHFPLGTSLKVIQYENFTKNKRTTMMEILDWIGAPPHNWTEKDLEDDHGPVRFTVPIPVMSDEVKIYLQHLYKPFNDKLADLLGENWRGVWDLENGTVEDS